MNVAGVAVKPLEETFTRLEGCLPHIIFLDWNLAIAWPHIIPSKKTGTLEMIKKIIDLGDWIWFFIVILSRDL
jgi:hypothetical protein